MHLSNLLDQEDGALPLPMIQNKKTVDPRGTKSRSTGHISLKLQWGRPSSRSRDQRAVCVPRSRFAAVKTTSDLFALRSDAYEQEHRTDALHWLSERAGQAPGY